MWIPTRHADITCFVLQSPAATVAECLRRSADRVQGSAKRWSPGYVNAAGKSQAEVVSKSRNKIHQTWERHISRSLYCKERCAVCNQNPRTINPVLWAGLVLFKNSKYLMKKEQKWQFFYPNKEHFYTFLLTDLLTRAPLLVFLTVYFKYLFNLIKNMKIYG